MTKKVYKQLKVDHEKARRDRNRLLFIKRQLKPIMNILEQVKPKKVGDDEK